MISKPIVTLKNVAKTFDNGTEALRGLSFDLVPRERVSLLGASGCGKSTALRIISGLDEATSGDVQTGLRDDEKLGFVFQDPTLLPWATVFDNVAKPLALSGTESSEIEERVRSVLLKVDLGDFADAYPHELSGGMKMRVSIARALVIRPALLLMDEPFAALDEITRFRLNDLLLEQQEQDGFTLLFVTHSVFESVYLSDRVMVMSPRPGRITEGVDTSIQSPRNQDYRLSAHYIETCRQVSSALDASMNSPNPYSRLD